MKEVTRKVRYELFQFYLQECCPPTEDELAKLSGLGSCEIPSILRKPEEEHRIVLYKHESCAPTPMAMAHLFPHLHELKAEFDNLLSRKVSEAGAPLA
ncbi:hypothetical protein H107_06412 [Trichophyton rubrum CBS 202.88]|nr:hypothetical protein H107_06412 [Trichophyton rubrum CBS 202.88]